MVFFKFSNFFCYFFFEFSIACKVRRKRHNNFYFVLFSTFSILFSLILILFHPIFASKAATTVFYNFLIFFCYFFGISIALRVRTKQNNNLYFLSFSALSNLFWQEMTPYWFYDNFFTFFAISLEFSITCRVGTEWNGTITLIFSLSHTFPTYVGLKQSHNGIFEFFEFFTIFLDFSITQWVGTEQNNNFYFLSFTAFSYLFWLEMKP